MVEKDLYSETEKSVHQGKTAFGWLSFVAFFSVMNETVFNVALPDIAADFGVQPSAAGWVNTSFILSFAVGSIIYSRISDMYGLKRPLLIGLMTYGAGSLFCMLAHAYFPAVIFARFLQGAGASAVPALIMVMITRFVCSEDRGKSFGIVGSLVAAGEGAGPAIGGMIAHYIHWSFLFLPPMAVLLSVPYFSRRLSDEAVSKRSMDVLGICLLSFGIVMFALFTAQYRAVYIAAGVLALCGFAFYIRRVKHPFIEPSLFSNRMFVVIVLSGCILLGTVAGFISMVPYMMRAVYHMSADTIGGGIIFPGTIGVIFFGFLSGALVDRFGNRPVFSLGITLIAASFVAASQIGDRAPWVMTALLVSTFCGLSFIKTVISSSASETLKEEEAGAGMGILNFACFLSEGIGIAFVGGLLAMPRFDIPFLPVMGDEKAVKFGYMLFLFTAFVLAGGLLYVLTGRRKKR
ncbi:MFS transporter [Bacillus glycinifermentans]|uniref:MFS transporter n=1 Tax=Bacillus TaxID=1386 RepID=UPI0015829507|nr:MFS transporter [Bacillus glycinifermentans]NUJ19103.1 MFS transporter [Bacillus glycinifermentans]